MLLAHAKADDLPSINIIGAGLSEGTRYNAVLLVGPRRYVGRRSISIGGGGGGGGLFGDALSGGGDEGIVEGETGAEWLEVRVTQPGAEPTVARRTIFDRIGQAMRETGAIDPYAFPKAELVDLGPQRTSEYLPLRALYAFSILGGSANAKALLEGLDFRSPARFSLLAGAFHIVRQLVSAELAERMGIRSFDDSPSIAAWVLSRTLMGYDSAVDIWHRSFGALGLTGSEPIAPPSMLAGAAAHVAERITFGEGRAPSGSSTGEPSSVGAIFDKASSQGIPVRLIANDLPADMPLEPGQRALIERALDLGSLVVVPEEAVTIDGRSRLGWWLIDPRTGATVDEREDGWGTASEDTIIDEAMGGTAEEVTQPAVLAPEEVTVIEAGLEDTQLSFAPGAITRVFDVAKLMGW